MKNLILLALLLLITANINAFELVELDIQTIEPIKEVTVLELPPIDIFLDV